ncbi:MAG: hypothetical protein V4614_15820 [Pseudomonadota bacterium]
MTVSHFFEALNLSYLSELDDLRLDSEGQDVLNKRLDDKRQEIVFLSKMMEVNPEMVAVVLHRGFSFSLPAVMDDLLSREADEFPEWQTFADVVSIAPWAQPIADAFLKEPGGEWFLTAAAGLEYMAARPAFAPVSAGDDQEDDDVDGEQDDEADGVGGVVESDNSFSGGAGAGKEAADDWMADQGFDRKD